MATASSRPGGGVSSSSPSFRSASWSAIMPRPMFVMKSLVPCAAWDSQSEEGTQCKGSSKRETQSKHGHTVQEGTHPPLVGMHCNTEYVSGYKYCGCCNDNMINLMII